MPTYEDPTTKCATCDTYHTAPCVVCGARCGVYNYPGHPRHCYECYGRIRLQTTVQRQERKAARLALPLSSIQPVTPAPLIRHFAYRGMVTMLAGREGSGKSSLLRYIVASYTNGEHWLTGEPIDPGVVLWCGEERPEHIAAHFELLGCDADLIRVVSLDTLQDARTFHSVVDATGARLVVIDPIADVMRDLDERSYTAVRAALHDWRPQADTALVAVHHAHREKDIRRDSVPSYYGSVGIGSSIDLLFDYTTLSKQHPNTRLLQTCKSRIDGLQGAELYVDRLAGDFREVNKPVVEKPERASKRRVCGRSSHGTHIPPRTPECRQDWRGRRNADTALRR